MNLTFDRNLFVQIGLDSGSLTMLGTIVHSFSKPGLYRGVVHEGEKVKAAFAINSDNNSASAQASIDLASLVSGSETSFGEDCRCYKQLPSTDHIPPTFVVNPRGYILFHVAQGSGGYYVHVRRADAEKEDKGYDTRSLAEGDVFTAIILRPGAYSIVNTLTKAQAELIVSYPKPAGKRYQPAPPVRVVCNQKSFEPNQLKTDPGQGVIFECRAYSRIQIKLEKPDDGAKASERVRPTGRIANRLR